MKNSIFEFRSEIDNRSAIYIIAFFAILLGFFIIRENLYGDEIRQNALLSEKRNTSVVDIYKDRNEHNFTFVKYSNGKKELLDFPYQIGDSVSKKKGDSIEYIFRNKKIIKNNWLKTYQNLHK